MPPDQSISPDCHCLGVRPKWAPTLRDFENRDGSSTAAAYVSATSGPTPGTVIRRRHGSLAFARAAICRSSAAISRARCSTTSTSGCRIGRRHRVLESGVDCDPELRLGKLGWPQALGLQDRPDPVAQIKRLTAKLLADRQQSPGVLRIYRLDPNGAELPDSHQVGDAARIVLVRLVAEAGPQGGRGVGRIDDDDRQVKFAQSARQPRRSRASFQANLLDLGRIGCENVCDDAGHALHRALPHHRAVSVQHANCGACRRNIQTYVKHSHLLDPGQIAGEKRHAWIATGPYCTTPAGYPILFRRSIGFVLCSLVRCWRGKDM